MIINSIVKVDHVKVKKSIFRALHFQTAVAIVLSVLLPAAFVLFQQDPPVAGAETATLTGQTIDGDFGVNNFAENFAADTSCAGGTHCDAVDEDGEVDFLGTGTDMNGTTAEEEFTTTNPSISGTLLSVNEVRVIVRAGINGACQGGGGTNCDGLNTRIFIDGAYNGTTNSTANLTTTATDYTYTWSGLTASAVNDLRIEIIRVAQGGGGASGSDDDLRIYDVRYEIDYTYLPARPMLTQEDYIFENDDGFSGSETKLAGTGANDASFGTDAWTSTSSITADDGSKATVASMSNNSSSNYLKATNFGFDIPANATITGIQAKAELQSDLATTVYDSRVRIVKGGTIGTTDKSRAGTLYWSTLDNSVTTYPGISTENDLWGLSWTAVDINSSDFGFAIAAANGSTSGPWANIDHIQLIVHYNDPETGQAGSQFSSPKTLDNVRVGERTNLRMHLKNTGEGVIAPDDELALFYDRNDGLWTKVESTAKASVGAGSGCGASGSTAWTCTTVDNDTDSTGQYSSLAFSPSGSPYFSYYDATATSLMLAQYVGSGGSGCGASGSTAWTCTTVDNDTDNTGQYSSLAFSPSGSPYISYLDVTANTLMVAQYVGSGGSGCGASGSTAWTCTNIAPTFSSTNTSIAIDSSGKPWVSYINYQGNGDLYMAQYVGSGGSGCTSSAWTCANIQSSGLFGYGPSIAIDSSGDPWVSWGTDNIGQIVRYVGSGGSCDNTAWTCDTVDSSSGSIAFDSSGVAWMTYSDGSATSLKIAQYVGSGGSGCTSSAWTCTTVDNDTDSTGQYSSLAFSPAGTKNISYYDATATSLMLAQYVGSGGSGCGASGSTAWTCTTVDNDTDNTGQYSSLAFSPKGKPYISYYDFTATAVKITEVSRQGEISISPSQTYINGGVHTESHVDMTSATDTANRDDADCISASTTWNNGTYFGAEVGTGLALPAGDTTAQCTEVMWTLDTSQAVPGTTYRFVVATKDSFNPSKGVWRGPIAVDEYPTITIAEDFEQSTRYSKTLNPTFANCTDTDWGCEIIESSGVVGEYTSLAFSPDGTPYISYTNDAESSVGIAEYVGSGGTGCAITSWECTIVDRLVSGTFGEYTSLAFSPDGTPFISYYDNSESSLTVASYVGGGGTGCFGGIITDWTCTTVDNDTDITGRYTSLAITSTGVPYISYYDANATSLMIAQYVGSGGTGCGASGSSEWTCTTVDNDTDGTGTYNTLALSPEGIPYISYYDANATSLMIAQYVGSGGTGCGASGSSAWSCTTVDNDTSDSGRHTSLAFNSSGTPFISYQETSTRLKVAQYVGGTGGTGCGASGSSAWSCTTVHDNGGLAGFDTSIAFDANDTPFVSYFDDDLAGLVVARYVASGGTGCGTSGSTAWTCTLIDNLSTSASIHSHLAFDTNGVAWVSYYDDVNTNLKVAKLDLPTNELGSNRSSRMIPSGDYQYHLGSGRSPYNSTGVNCTGNSLFSGYCGLDSDNGDYDSLLASGPNESPLYGMATKVGANTTVPSISWIGNTNLAPSTSSPSGSAGDIVIEVYRFGSTNAWEEVARDSTSTNCSINNCVLSGIPSGTVGEYFETINSEYWYYVRVYQETDGTTTVNFKVDAFKAAQLGGQLGSGGFFRDGSELPLNLQR